MKRTIVIKPGETAILPQGVTIDSIILDGAIDVTSTCNNLPAPSSYKCGFFQIVIDNDDNEEHSMDEEYTWLSKLVVGSNTYIMNQRLGLGENPATPVDEGTLNTFIPDQVIFSFKETNGQVNDKRQTIRLYFQVPEDLWDEIELEVVERGNYSYFKPLEATCGEYPTA